MLYTSKSSLTFSMSHCSNTHDKCAYKWFNSLKLILFFQREQSVVLLQREPGNYSDIWVESNVAVIATIVAFLDKVVGSWGFVTFSVPQHDTKTFKQRSMTYKSSTDNWSIINTLIIRKQLTNLQYLAQRQTNGVHKGTTILLLK